MKKNVSLKKWFCLALSLIMLASFAGCASSDGKTLMTLGKQKLSVNQYDLMLSRMKGTLYYNDYPVDSDEFWDTIWSSGGATYNDYFCSVILDEAKLLVAKLYLFDEHYQLELPRSAYDDADELIDGILDFYFDGSKTAFNREIAQYGMNMKMLREAYLLERKTDQLSSYISSITGDAAREEYYRDNFVCFRQILFPLYEFIYETDENGDLIYYKENSENICYDHTNGTPRSGTDGKSVTDVNGDVIYFLSDGRIAYDTKNGELRGVDADNDGYIDYRLFDDTEKSAVRERAEKILSFIDNGDFTTFEMYGDQNSDDEIWDSYPNGIFLNVTKSYSQAYLNTIRDSLKEAADGAADLFESENAYHLVMKYSLEEKGYADTANEDWFGDFESDLADHILESICEEYLDRIVIDEDALKEAMNMKTVGTNLEY